MTGFQRYARERITSFLKQLEMVIDQMCANPDMEIGKVYLVTKEDKPNLPDPTTPLDTTYEGPIYQKLSMRAAEHPERPLIYAANGVWTYKQIDDMSNRLANHLVAKGIKPEDRVAMYAHRSATLVVGIMGILKSGATFTVIDPAYVGAPRGPLHGGVAEPFNTDVRSILMVFIGMSKVRTGTDLQRGRQQGAVRQRKVLAQLLLNCWRLQFQELRSHWFQRRSRQ